MERAPIYEGNVKRSPPPFETDTFTSVGWEYLFAALSLWIVEESISGNGISNDEEVTREYREEKRVITSDHCPEQKSLRRHGNATMD